MSDLWGEEEEFQDMPEEARTVKKTAQELANQLIPPIATAPIIRRQPIVAQAVKEPGPEEEQEMPLETEEESEEDFSSVLNDAHLRLEQGSLYKMIMNHNLFEGMDADPKAIQNVQREIRKFARERMEIMLGMRRETSQVERLEIDFPFNALEVEILKKLAFTATKGASENSDRFVPEVKRVTEEVRNIPKKTLNSIGGSTSPKKAPNFVSKSAAAKLPTKPTAPLKRTKLDATIEQVAMEEGIPVEVLRHAVNDNYQPLSSPLENLSEEEKTQRMKQTAQRIAQKRSVKSASAIPMATPEQEAMLAVERATQMQGTPGMAALLAKVSNMPIKNP